MRSSPWRLTASPPVLDSAFVVVMRRSQHLGVDLHRRWPAALSAEAFRPPVRVVRCRLTEALTGSRPHEGEAGEDEGDASHSALPQRPASRRTRRRRRQCVQIPKPCFNELASDDEANPADSIRRPRSCAAQGAFPPARKHIPFERFCGGHTEPDAASADSARTPISVSTELRSSSARRTCAVPTAACSCPLC
jgi:hypothetical protein